QALLRMGAEHGEPMRVISAVEAANERQKLRLAEKVQDVYGEDLAGRRFALWGLAFKPNTDDMREAPSLSIIAELTRRGAEVRAFDPVAMEQARPLLAHNPAVSMTADMYEALDGADALLIATEWKVFRAPDLERVKRLLKRPLVIDGRNLWVPAEMREQGFDYQGIGRA
ncbi:UDP-glucose 6-dehydrogenase, partial [Bordetella hinzii]|nr:UDP-glucose 6-dehydrogenase [Bordetella hinzii]